MQNPTPAATERTPTADERAAESARLARLTVVGAVRRAACPLCGAAAYGPCQLSPAADHLARWLAAYTARRITRDQLTAEVVRLVVVTRWCVVPERAA
ncbi:MAG: hypothetical protein ACYCO9_06365 [Streptosporangiaceae bacterium]